MSEVKHPWEEYGGPAFPSGTDGLYFKGMTLRDYFAAQAMHGMAKDDVSIKAIARVAYEISDAMLAERVKE